MNNKPKSKKSNQTNPINRISSETGRIPPQALEMESAVLGAILINKDAIFEIIDILTPDSFYKEGNKLIFNAMLSLFDQTDPIDILTVTNRLRENDNLEAAGGAHYISVLTSNVSSSVNIEYHARIISQNGIKRNLISLSGNVLHKAYEDSTDVFDVLDVMEKGLTDIGNKVAKKEAQSIAELYTEATNELAHKQKNPEMIGVKSGITELDKVTGSWQNSELIIIAARPGMGKTAFIISNTLHAAIHQEKAVAIFSLEMPNLQLTNRMISSVAKVNGEAIRKATCDSSEWVRITNASGPLSNAKIFIDDTPAITIREFRSKSIKLKRKQNIEMIIVDYLQLMVSPEHAKFREQEISSISRELKKIAKELNIPIIALAQLSRDVEKRGGDKKPILSDLRESGSLEQDADIVIFLYRPEYYGFTTFTNSAGEEMPTDGLAEAIIAKNRHGGCVDVPMRFVKNYAKFENFSSFEPEDSSDDSNLSPPPSIDDGLIPF